MSDETGGGPSSLDIAFVMDPLDGLIVDEDTTLAFMLAAQQRGHRVHYVAPEDLEANGARAWADATECRVSLDPDDYYELGETSHRRLNAFDAVLMRKDPPFDVDYLHAAHLLELAEQDGVFVMNRPAGLRAANEKLYALQFAEYMPDTIVTRHRKRIRSFMADHGGNCILKPVDGFGGRGVFKLAAGATNTSAIIDQMTGEGSERVVVQAYLPEATEGDKRVLMLDGEPMGAILRVPPSDDHRGNIHVGGSVEATGLSDYERALCEEIGQRLVEDGLYFVGLDLIGGKLTEVNVTSPTGIQEMSRLNDVDGSGRVIDWVAEQAGEA